MDEREFNISNLERKVNALKAQEGQTQELQPVWKRFDELLGQMSDDQKSFVAGDEEVINQRQKVMATFNDWMFEKYKNEFAAIPAFAGIAQEYVDAVASTAQKYGQKAANLQKKNEELKRQLAELQKAKEEDLL